MILDTLSVRASFLLDLRLHLASSIFESPAQRLRNLSRGAATLTIREADGA